MTSFMPAGLAGATATGVAGATFVYNRQNFMFDQLMRYDRYVAGRLFACAQAQIYRQDIRDMTGLTTNKCDRYHFVGMVLLVGVFQLCLAGRLGLHGPSPPGHIKGPYMASLIGGWMYVVLANWLAMHASARATSGCVHLLTRAVRLPIPSPKQLDMARNWGNKYEHQRVQDMFRVPFLVPHVNQEMTDPTDVDEDDLAANSDGIRKRSAMRTKKSTFPAWIQDEHFATGEHSAGTNHEISSNSGHPDHFELFRRLQYEWWSHEVYARLSMVVGLIFWSHALAYYSQGHCFAELRDMWSAWTGSIMASTLAYLLYAMDFRYKGTNFFPAEYIQPLAPLLGCLAANLDYRYEYSETSVTVTVIIGFIVNIIHLLWTVRLMELCSPDEPPAAVVDAPSTYFWPPAWRLPSAFVQSVYMVAPPYRVEPGQACLQKEMELGSGALRSSMKSRSQVPDNNLSHPENWPWKVFRSGLLIMTFIWVFLLCGRVTDTVKGERNLLRRPTKPRLIPPWTRNNTRGEWWHAGGFNRRLAETEGSFDEEPPLDQAKLHDTIAKLLPVLNSLADGQKNGTELQALSTASHAPLDLLWPQSLEPTVLACGPQGKLAAFAPEGIGAVVEEQNAATSVSLGGVENMGQLLGASWQDNELLGVSSSGKVVECSGFPITTECRQSGPQLPIEEMTLDGAAVTRVEGSQIRVALIIKNSTVIMDPAVVVYELHDGEWLALAESRLPRSLGSAASLVQDELLLAAQDGSVVSWQLENNDGPTAEVQSAQDAKGLDMAWQGACRHKDGIARLALRQPMYGGRWQPEVVVSTNMI
jgi:hypothetical protein